MESWVLQGDSYSFLPSAAHNFNLEHLDGPNRVEIFDITSIPSARNAISETTCLCDIFGDDCESPTLSSSPMSASFRKQNVEETTLADDVNSSPGSYHTANGSEHLSIASETFEDLNDSCGTPSNDFSLETNDSSFSPCHLKLSNNTKDNNSVNGALVSIKVDDTNPSQAENPQVSYMPHFDNLGKPENICDQQLVTATTDNGLTTQIKANDSDLAQEPRSHFHSPEQKIINTHQDSITLSELVPKNTDTTKKIGIASPGQMTTDSQQKLIGNLIHETVKGTELSASESQHAKSTKEIESPETFTDIKHHAKKKEVFSTGTNALNSAHNQEIISSDYVDLKQDIITPDLSNDIRCDTVQTDVILLDPNVLSDFTKDNTQRKEQRTLFSETPENTDTLKINSQAALKEMTSEAFIIEQNSVGVTIMDKELLCLSPIANDDSFSKENISVDAEKEEDKCTGDLIKISPNENNLALPPECAHSQSGNNGEWVNYSNDTVKTQTTSQDNDTSAIKDLENAQTMSLSTFDSSNKTNNVHQCTTIPFERKENKRLTPFTNVTEGLQFPECSDMYSPSDSPTLTMESEMLPINKAPSPSTLKSCLTPATLNNLETHDGLQRLSLSSRDPMWPIIEDVKGCKNFQASTDLMHRSNPQEISDMLVTHEGESKPLPILSNSVNLLPTEVKGSCSESFESTTVFTKDTSPTSYVQSSLSRDIVSSPKIKDEATFYVLTEQIPVSGPCISLRDMEHDIPLRPIYKKGLITTSEVISLLEPSDEVQLMENAYKSSKDCHLILDECTIVAEAPCSQIQETRDVATELPDTKSHSDEMNESWERCHGCMTDILAGVSEEKRFKRKSASNEIQNCLIAVRHGESPSSVHSIHDSKFENCSFRNKGWSEEISIHKELSSVGGFIVEGPSSGEQAVLSINTRNRKESAQLSPELSSRDTKSGIPAHYFESPPTIQQQQTLVGEITFQKENNYGAKLSSSSERNNSGDGYIQQECTSETFNMESKIDEVDNEAKRAPERAFMKQFSSQENYLDVVTHVSQPSTVNSLGVSTCVSYAELPNKSSHETEELLCHSSTFLPNDILKPRKSLDVDSFECVDVIVESKAEQKSGKKTVPKRQIQFKRQSKTQKVDSIVNTENVGDRSCEVTLHQPDTAVLIQDFEDEPEINTGKNMLQKSASLEETSTKSEKASSIIKNVLSRKMDISTKPSIKSSSLLQNENNHTEILTGGKSSNIECQSSSTFCDLRSSPNENHVTEKVPDIPKKDIKPKIPPKPFPKPKCVPFHIISGGMGLYDTYPVGDIVSTSHFESSEGKPSKNKMSETDKTEERHVEERHNRIPTGFLVKGTNCAVSRHSIVTNNETNQSGVQEIPRQQDGRVFLSKTPDITLKNVINKDKKISLIKSPVPLETRVFKDPECQFETECLSMDKNKLDSKAENCCQKEEEKKPKPIDNVTQSVSFKTTNTIHQKEDFQNQEQIPHSNPLRIEYKAISLKDKQLDCSEVTNLQDKPDNSDKTKDLHINSVMKKYTCFTQKTPKESSNTLMKSQEEQEKVVNLEGSVVDVFVGSNNILLGSPENSKRKMEIKPTTRASNKEASTSVLPSDGTSKTMQNPVSSCSSEENTVCSHHCVAMLLKEKGMQADIGVCDAIHQETEYQSKHVNRLEVPLPTYSSEETTEQSQKVQNIAVSCHQMIPTNKSQNSNESGKVVRCSPECKVTSIQCEVGENKALLLATNELEKMTGHSTSIPKIVPPVAASYKAEMRSFSSSTKSHAVPVTTSKEIELPIQVRSISNDRTKPSTLFKASQKLPVAQIKSVSTNSSKQDVKAISFLKQQAHFKEDDITEKSTSKNNGHSNEVSNTKPINATSSSVYDLTPPPLTCKHSPSMRLTSNQEQQQLPTHSCQSPYQSLLPVSQAIVKNRPETSSSNPFHSEDFHLHSSDDPPSYDERERFSSLMHTDLTQIELNKYHPSTRPSLCSCSPCSQSHFRQTYRRSQNQSPETSHLPLKIISYSGAQLQPQVNSIQCQSDSQSVNYSSRSPKTAAHQASAMIQPLHLSQSCHALAKQPFGTEQQQLSNIHMDKRPGNQHSPHVSGASYQEHRCSPNITAMDPRAHVFSQQALPPFEQDYVSDGPVGSGILYPDNVPGLVYGQGSRRVLLDPETGKYFYIDVPIHPIRKMLYDPEIGQYVEVVIPQQSMSYTGMYPPTAASYPPLHCPPQYLSYAVPPHIQSAQQPQLAQPQSDPSAPTSLNQISAGYKNSAAQIPKLDIKVHQPQDQNYLENMYYLPTGINTSPNSKSLDCYHKSSSNMPAAGGRRA